MQAGQNVVVGQVTLTEESAACVREGDIIVRTNKKVFEVLSKATSSEIVQVTGVAMSCTPTKEHIIPICYRGAIDALFPDDNRLNKDKIKPGRTLTILGCGNKCIPFGRLISKRLLPFVRGNPQYDTEWIRVWLAPGYATTHGNTPIVPTTLGPATASSFISSPVAAVPVAPTVVTAASVDSSPVAALPVAPAVVTAASFDNVVAEPVEIISLRPETTTSSFELPFEPVNVQTTPKPKKRRSKKASAAADGV